MMRFNKLRLVGFKSFVEPSDFAIDGGLTGVVGPNGCGKSNLVEALRWVMGENSYKNMRASGMEDVIFSGSGMRPSRNSAEVLLYLDNRARMAPAAFNSEDELQVSRRIERDKGSTYRINGKEARAKDVQLLFADQSTGARSPSMVGQGKVGELIQAKPQARRALLEEAAGISGLHSRRHEAELRLRAAEQNLDRLDDVSQQLTSQIENLKRQARQAIRFKGLSEELRKAEATLLHIRWTEAQAAEGEARDALTRATSQVGAASVRQVEAAKAQAVGNHGLPALREAEAAAAAIIQRITVAQDQLEADARRASSRRDELGRRIGQLRDDIAREQRLAEENQRMLSDLRDEEARLQAEAAGTDDAEATLKAALDEAGAVSSAAEARYGEALQRKADADATRSALERRIRDAGDRVTRLGVQLQELDGEIGKLEARLGDLPNIADRRVALELAEAAIASAEAAGMDAEAALETARLGEEAARPVHAEARAQLDRIETETRTLTKLMNARASGGLFAPVLDQISVDRGFETALGAAFGDDLDLPTDPSASAFWAESAPAEDDPVLPDVATPLADRVRAPAALLRRLRQIGVVESAEVAARLAPHLKSGQRLVTRDGALWRWDGLRVSADAPSAAAIRLDQKNRLKELDSEAVAATVALRSAEAALQGAKTTLETAREGERVARQTIRDHQQAVAAARAKVEEAERMSGDLAARRDRLTATREQVLASRNEAEAERAGAVEALDALVDGSALAAELADAEGARRDATDGLQRANVAYEGLRRENEARNARQMSIAKDRERWTTRIEGASTQIEALQARQVEAEDELKALDERPDDLAVRRRELSYEREKAAKDRSSAADRLAEAEEKQRTFDRAATDAIQSLASAREARARAEERQTAASERLAEIVERIREALQCAPQAMFDRTGLNRDDPLPSPSAIERNISQLRAERERLGAVNLRAEEEQRELAEQLQTLTAERDDVIEAIRKLRAAIQSLNREGRERLLTAFEEVNTHFKALFTRLFGGGEAELQLIDHEDPLEAGLEILARPPGKRPQTMTLLSGGEQALTALALIFAVFLTNPAPICVLDEVDAPLDDHNVERFCDLMDEMVKLTETRFVIITHNPITMARMDRLFGVTMAEQGVSQLVSVDLQTAEQLREAS